MKKATPITCCDIKKYADYYKNDAVRVAMTNVFSKTGMGDMAFNTEASQAMQFMFSIDIKTMSATNQKGSGRCWLFAATNVLSCFLG